MDTQRTLQERAYRIPYHYLPVVEDGRFSQHQYWSWGYRYLGRLHVTLTLLAERPFGSLLDIGCGDGRFLREVRQRFAGTRLLGIDSSAAAIRWAQALNPDLPFETADALEWTPAGRFDVVTLLEVIEHVPPDRLGELLRAAASHLQPNGRLILTTPHVNARLDAKHHQHFDCARLREALEGAFDDISCVPFDYVGWPTRLLRQALGGSGRFFILTHAGLNTWFYRRYMRRCLQGSGERGCHRLAAVARKRVSMPDDASGPGGRAE